MTGCQSLPTVHRVDREHVEVTAKDALPDCDWPELKEGALNGVVIYYTDKAGLTELHACRVTARANQAAANGNATALRASKQMHNNAVTESAVLLDMAEQQLQQTEEARREVVKENWLTRGVLGLVLVLVAL